MWLYKVQDCKYESIESNIEVKAIDTKLIWYFGLVKEPKLQASQPESSRQIQMMILKPQSL